MANKALLKLVRRLAIQDELLAMRLRGTLIQQPVAQAMKQRLARK